MVTPEGLAGGFNAIRQALEVIEHNVKLHATICCEPQLGKRGLYPTLSTKDTRIQVSAMMNLISYCDGKTLLEIAELINEPVSKLLKILASLFEAGLVKSD